MNKPEVSFRFNMTSALSFSSAVVCFLLFVGASVASAQQTTQYRVETRKFCSYQCRLINNSQVTPNVSTPCRTDADCVRDCRARCPTESASRDATGPVSCATDPAPRCADVQVEVPVATSTPSRSAGSSAGGRLATPIDPLGSIRIEEAIGSIIRYLLGVAGALFLGMFVYAGILWMTAGGKDDRVKSSQTTLRNSIVGMIIIIGSYAGIATLMDISRSTLELRLEQPSEQTDVTETISGDDSNQESTEGTESAATRPPEAGSGTIPPVGTTSPPPVIPPTPSGQPERSTAPTEAACNTCMDYCLRISGTTEAGAPAPITFGVAQNCHQNVCRSELNACTIRASSRDPAACSTCVGACLSVVTTPVTAAAFNRCWSGCGDPCLPPRP